MYTKLIQDVYRAVKFQVMTYEPTNQIFSNREVRPGNTISPKLFTLAFENLFNWVDKSIKIDEEWGTR